MNRTRITRAVRARVVAPLALCFVFQQTTDGTPAAGQTGRGAADLILHHGFIWTVDESKPQAEAVAARGDRIIKVSGNEEVLALRGEHTRLIDLKGAFVTPGFNNSHVHFAGAASFFWNLQLMDVHSDEAFAARVKDYVAADTENVAHIRNSSGRVTGAMRIKDARGVEAQFLGGFNPDHDKRAKMTENALGLVREAGATSFQDMSDHEQLQLYQEFLEAGRLTARVNFRYGIAFRGKDQRDSGRG